MKKMWNSLKSYLKENIRDYEKADNITGLDDYAGIELDAWHGVMQEIEDQYKDDEND